MMEYDRGYMADTPMLEVRDLTKQYKGFLLDKVSFTLPKGFIMGYVGPNGAGKSTTLGLITKTHRADAGEVLLDGKRYEEDPVSYKEKIGYVSSVSYFRPTMNIKDAVLLLRQFYPTFSKEKFYHYVKAWDLPEKKKFSAFSTGTSGSSDLDSISFNTSSHSGSFSFFRFNQKNPCPSTRTAAASISLPLFKSR